MLVNKFAYIIAASLIALSGCIQQLENPTPNSASYPGSFWWPQSDNALDRALFGDNIYGIERNGGDQGSEF